MRVMEEESSCLPFFLVIIESGYPAPKLRSYWSRIRRFSFVPGIIFDGVEICSDDDGRPEKAAWVMSVARGSDGGAEAEGTYCLQWWADLVG